MLKPGRASMVIKPGVLLLCAAAAGCASHTPTAHMTQDVTSVAQTLDDSSAQACPFPADAAHYETTTLTARGRYTPAPDLSVFNAIKQGCAVLAFTVGDGGKVSSSTILSDNPAGFGPIAANILRWNDYAEGAYGDTMFIVRVAGATLPSGGAMTVMAFKDSVVNLEIPP